MILINKKKILLALGLGAALSTTGAWAQVFWTDDAGHAASAVEAGSIWRMNLDGSNPTELISNLSRPIGIVVDEANGQIYWAEDGVSAAGEPSRIRRANLDGTGIEILFEETSDGFTNAQDIVLVGDTLYWTDFFQGVMSGNKDGTGSPTVLGGSPPNYTAIGYDNASNHLFYGEPNNSIGLYRMAPDGQNDQWVYSPMVALDWSFNTLAIDSEKGYIYYGDVNVNTIRRRDIDGTNEVVIATDATQVHGLKLVGDDLYWAGRPGVIGKVSIEPGSTSEVLATGLPTTTVFGIAVIPGSEGFATWIDGYEVDPSVSAPGDDADGDGIPNVMEYALGGDPTAAFSATLPAVETQEVSGDNYLTITHLRRVGGGDDTNGDYAVSDLIYSVRASDDLVNWEATNAVFVSATTNGVPSGFELATYRASTAISLESRQFLRLDVSLQ